MWGHGHAKTASGPGYLFCLVLYIWHWLHSLGNYTPTFGRLHGYLLASVNANIMCLIVYMSLDVVTMVQIWRAYMSLDVVTLIQTWRAYMSPMWLPWSKYGKLTWAWMWLPWSKPLKIWINQIEYHLSSKKTKGGSGSRCWTLKTNAFLVISCVNLWFVNEEVVCQELLHNK
jgi:hypothetical protein